MSAHESIHGCQAEPYPRSSVGQLYVRLEDALLLIDWDAGPGVADFDTPASVSVEHANLDASHAGVAHVLHRVAHQVQEHAGQDAAAACHRARRYRRERESDPALLRLQCEAIDHIFQDRCKLRGSTGLWLTAGTRKRQQAIDKCMDSMDRRDASLRCARRAGIQLACLTNDIEGQHCCMEGTQDVVCDAPREVAERLVLRREFGFAAFAFRLLQRALSCRAPDLAQRENRRDHRQCDADAVEERDESLRLPADVLDLETEPLSLRRIELDDPLEGLVDDCDLFAPPRESRRGAGGVP